MNSVTESSALLSLVHNLDQLTLVILRDERNFFGTLRSFDQYGNLVLEDTKERIFIDGKYGERCLGPFLIHGESISFLGSVNFEFEKSLLNSEKWHKLEFQDAYQLLKQQKQSNQHVQLTAKIAKLKGLCADVKDFLYE